MKKLRKISVTTLTHGISATIPLSSPEAKCGWINGEVSENFESISFDVVIADVGLCQVVFPFRDGLVEKLSESVLFGSVLDLNDLGKVEDIMVSFYNDALNVKILMAK